MINPKKFKKQVVSSKLNLSLIDLAIFLPSTLSSISILENLTKLKVPKYFFKNSFFFRGSFLIKALKFPLVLISIKDISKQFSVLSKKLFFFFKIKSYLFFSNKFIIFLSYFKIFTILKFLFKKSGTFLLLYRSILMNSNF